MSNPCRYVNIQKPKREQVKIKQQKEMDDIKMEIFHFLVWAVIGLIVYIVAYEVMCWERVWAIVAAVFWPITLSVAFFYYVGGYIISLF